MTLKSDVSSKEKLTCGFKYDMRNLVNLSKVYKVWAKKYKGVIFHGTDHWCKIWINPDVGVSKMAWGIGWTLFIRASKILKTVE